VAQLSTLGGSRYENIYMAFHIRVPADLSDLLGIVIFINHGHIFKSRLYLAGHHSTCSLSEYMDSILSAAVAYLRDCIVTSQRVNSRCSTRFCYHDYCSHGFAGLRRCRSLHVTALCYDCLIYDAA
jgi:hypothetical protein